MHYKALDTHLFGFPMQIFGLADFVCSQLQAWMSCIEVMHIDLSLCYMNTEILENVH